MEIQTWTLRRECLDHLLIPSLVDHGQRADQRVPQSRLTIGETQSSGNTRVMGPRSSIVEMTY
jgi:hypothetical protein